MPPNVATPSISIFTGLVGPIIPGFFGVDELSLVVLVGLAVLAALLIVTAPAAGSFFHYVIMLLCFFIGAIGVVTAAQVIVFYGAWEITGLFAWGMGQLGSENEQDRTGVMPLHAAGALGSFAMILGLALLAANQHSLALAPVPPDVAAAPGLAPTATLILVGIALKTFGLISETWSTRIDTPDSVHRGRGFGLSATTLAGAGVLTIGLYPFFRFFGPVLGNVPGWRETAFWGAAALAVLGALAALGDADYRRALAYGLFSQVCLLAMLYATGSPAAMRAAILGGLADAFAFTGLFVAVGMAEEATERIMLARMGGLARRLPLTAALFLLGSLAVIGLPPLGSFVADRLVAAAAAASPALAALWIGLVGLTAVYLVRLFVLLFLGEPHGPVQRERRWPVVVASGGLIGTLALLAALAPQFLALFQTAAAGVAG